MGVVMIVCPATGHEVSTGIEMCDVDRLPAVTAKMVCSACGRVHEWTKDDTHFVVGAHYRVSGVGTGGSP